MLDVHFEHQMIYGALVKVVDVVPIDQNDHMKNIKVGSKLSKDAKRQLVAFL